MEDESGENRPPPDFNPFLPSVRTPHAITLWDGRPAGHSSPVPLRHLGGAQSTRGRDLSTASALFH